MVLIGNDDKTSQSQNFALLSQYTGRRIFFKSNQRILTQESRPEETKLEGTNAPVILAEKYAQFLNQFINKPIKEQKEKLDKMRNSSILRAIVRSAEGFTLEDEEKYALLFNEGDRLKRIWEYIYVSFNEQEILLT